MYKILLVKLGHDWIEVEHGVGSLSSKVVINTKKMGGLTEEEWIKKYREEQKVSDFTKLKFVPLIQTDAWNAWEDL